MKPARNYNYNWFNLRNGCWGPLFFLLLKLVELFKTKLGLGENLYCKVATDLKPNY